MRAVDNIVAYFAAWQKLAFVSGKRVGDDHYSTSGVFPPYSGWEKSSVMWHNGWTHRGKLGKIRRWSAAQPSFPTFASQ
jgi:hypothetical protein